MTMTDVDPALTDMMDAVFAEYAASERPAEVALDADLWRRLDDLGLVRLTGSEESGGSGAGWHEAAELLSAAVRHGVRIPLAEHDLLACCLLRRRVCPPTPPYAPWRWSTSRARRPVCRGHRRRSGCSWCIPAVTGTPSPMSGPAR